jgi:phosphoribosylamine---glycine ligase
MRVLVIGSGGREHVLVWKLKQSRLVREVVCAPGNGGIQRDARCVPIQVEDHKAVMDLVRKERIDCVVVGPEAPLASGLTDHLREENVAVVGPSKSAARLESSKVFAKEFMVRHGIPTASFTVHEDLETARKRLISAETRYPLVIKADGLAAGKGVIVARTPAEAYSAINRIMQDREFGSAGDRVLVEEFLEGSEASFIVFTDGINIVPAVAAQDHKAVYDNDLGPNTGGMGAYSSDSILSPQLEALILDRIVRPTIDGMRAEGTPFQGLLYAGLMLGADGPKVLEFNVRMGDPEAQAILPRMESDLAVLFESLCAGKLAEYRPMWSMSTAVCVVLASGGYPGDYEKGKVISGLQMAAEDSRIMIFHSGTRYEGGNYLTNGGRVLGVTALEEELPAAIMSAYEAINKIHFERMHYRRDIGAKGLTT